MTRVCHIASISFSLPHAHQTYKPTDGAAVAVPNPPKVGAAGLAWFPNREPVPVA